MNNLRLNRLLQGPAVCLLIWITACSQHSPEQAVALPARFEGNRIFVDVAVRGGDTLRFFTDTGGGLFLYGDAVDRIAGWAEDSTAVSLRAVATDSAFPEPRGIPNHRLPIFRSEKKPHGSFGDGMLGQAWFADRIWTFDYPGQKLLLHRSIPPMKPESRRVKVGFRQDSTAARLLSFPRITTVVDGDSVDLLFDTGATVHLSAEAQRQLGAAKPAKATSFIVSEVFNRWRRQHPDWPVIPDADQSVPGMAMIQVAEVSIAGFAVGPVWFTERPDANFREYMSQWMDRQVDGALGGNAFRFFKITLDYPAANAHFLPDD